MSQLDRIGTFCEKCRQVICMCKEPNMKPDYQQILDRHKDEVAKEEGFDNFTTVVFFASRSDVNAILSEAALRAMREVVEIMMLDMYQMYFDMKYPCTTEDNDGSDMTEDDLKKWRGYNILLTKYQSNEQTNNALPAGKCVCHLDDEVFITNRQAFGGNIYKHAGVKFSTHKLWLHTDGDPIFIEPNETIYTLDDGDRFYAIKHITNN